MGENWGIKEYSKGAGCRILNLLKPAGICLLETFVAAVVLYDSIWGMLLLPIFIFINFLKKKEEERERFTERFRREYREFLNGIASGLSGGVSVERAFKEEEAELKIYAGEDSYLLGELHRINGEVSFNKPIEISFMDFARRCRIEEVEEFAEIFIFAKRMGGDYTKNIRMTADKIEQQMELKRDIDILTAEKRMEMKVMSIMPVAILIYIKFAASGFVAPLYESAAGRIVMTICFGIYLFCVAIGRKMIKIG